MVHIGAMFAALVTNQHWRWLLDTRKLHELRLPSPQRFWIGMGAAAGVAAAFNAPFGGILYSFEEVCSTWTQALTWRAFYCCMLVALTYNLLVECLGGALGAGLVVDVSFETELVFFRGYAFVWVTLIGAAGGALGAAYNLIVMRTNRIRSRLHTGGRSRVVEAVCASF